MEESGLNVDPYVRCTYTVLTMRKKLTRSGNSVALVLDRGLLEELELDESSEVELSTNGDVLVVTPVRSESRRRNVSRIIDEIDAKYAGVFRRLAE
jgi:antitoxin MazE